MKKEKFERLFESLAILSPSLNNVCERALDTVKGDETLPKKIKEDVIASVKALLFHSSELKDYVGGQYSDLNYIHDGREKYDHIKANAKRYIENKGAT